MRSCLASLFILALGAAATRAQTAPSLLDEPRPRSGDSIYALAVDPAQHRGDHTALLLDDGAVRLETDGTWRSTYRQVIQALDLAGAQEIALRWITYNSERQHVTVNWCMLVGRDGRILSDEPDQNGEAKDNATGVSWTHRVRRTIGFHHAQPGMMLDIRWTVEEHHPPIRGDLGLTWRISSDVRLVRRSRYVVDVPDSAHLHVVERNLDFAARTVEHDGRRIVTWATRDVSRVAEEPFAADSNGVRMSVWTYSLDSWEPVTRWFAARVEHAIGQGASRSLAQKAALLVSTAPTSEDTVRLIRRWVQEQVRTLPGDLELRDEPQRAPEQVLRDGYGDSEDASMLIVTLLRSVGVHSEPAIVARPSSLGYPFPGLDAVQRMLVAVPAVDGVTILDPTERYLPPGVVHEMLEGAWLFTLHRDGSATQSALPVLPPDSDATTVTVAATLAPDGSLAGRYEARSTGPGQRILRGAFADPELQHGQPSAVQELAHRLFPHARVDSATLMDESHGRALRASFTFRDSADALSLGDTTMLRLPFGDVGHLLAALHWSLAHPQRRFPIDAAAVMEPGSRSYELDLTLPDGWTADLPPDVDARSPFGSVIRTCAQDGRTLRIVERFVAARGLFPPTRSAELTAWLRAATETRAAYLLIDHPSVASGR